MHDMPKKPMTDSKPREPNPAKPMAENLIRQGGRTRREIAELCKEAGTPCTLENLSTWRSRLLKKDESTPPFREPNAPAPASAVPKGQINSSPPFRRRTRAMYQGGPCLPRKLHQWPRKPRPGRPPYSHRPRQRRRRPRESLAPTRYISESPRI